MSKAKFAAAKELIDEKDYAGARTILKSIDHPTAREWEKKLDTIAPVKRNKSQLITTLFILVGCSIIALILVVIALRPFNSVTGLNFASCDSRGWWESVKPEVTEFLDTGATASSTSRMSLAPIILQLSAVYRKYDAVKFPSCVDDAAIDLKFGMSNVVDGFNAFLGQGETLATIDLGIANQHFWDAAESLKDLSIYDYDYRLQSASLIWGGDEGSAVHATEDANLAKATYTPESVDTRPTLPPEIDLNGNG